MDDVQPQTAKLLLIVVDLWPIYRKVNASRFTEQVLRTSVALRCLRMRELAAVPPLTAPVVCIFKTGHLR